MNSLISVVLATYNGEKFLKEQLDSLINQTYKNLEIIICDDNSTDNTISIIQEYKKMDSRISLYLNTKNIGTIKNFEKAISLSNGEYIAISDQDDIWVLDKLQILFDNINDSTLIYHDDYLINENGKILFKSFFISNEIQININHNIKALMLNNWISGHASMFSSKLKKYLIPIDVKIEHYDMWIAIVASNFGDIKYLDLQLVYWRQHSNNTSGSKIQKRNLLQKVFKSIDMDTHLQWNKNRVNRLKYLKNIVFLSEYKDFINQAINYYTLNNRAKAFIFSLKHINLIVQKKGILRKIKYILLTLYAPRITDVEG